MRKMVVAVTLALLMALPLMAQPKVKVGGLFYLYNFYWQNADFNDSTSDADAHFYMHGDINATVNFDENSSLFVKVGAWGNYGQNPVTGEPGTMEPNVHVLEAYLKLKNLFNTPLCFQIGKQRLLYGNGMVAFDGGEDGTMGAKLTGNFDMVKFDLFTYKLIEKGGMGYLGTGMGAPGPDNLLNGAYVTVKPMPSVEVNGYFFAESNRGGDTLNNPRWLGIRSTGTPVKGLDYTFEFVMMSGSYDTVDYKGQAYEFLAHYALPMVKIGFGYVNFSGDKGDTPEKQEGYFSALPSPFIYDNFYDGWVGFGPAFMLSTPYGFSLTDLWSVTDLNVINGNVAFSFKNLSLRLDVFKYATNQAKRNDSKDLGMEIAVNFSYPLNGVGFGGGLGYWMPGKYFGENLEPMIGTILYFAKGF